ncbi:uncharacterized protein V2V93DRAFT_368570 [Kockiozyma suomiensis]|uniref:uncharacterized protein n=1 Tax=Kockiozyma suomiensis TaxID=1337062 RepID=UPI0033443584
MLCLCFSLVSLIFLTSHVLSAPSANPSPSFSNQPLIFPTFSFFLFTSSLLYFLFFLLLCSRILLLSK